MNESSSINQRLSWFQTFTPSIVTFHRIQTGEQVQEPSLAALEIDASARRQSSFSIENEFHASLPALKRCLAAGRAALDYRDAPGVTVYSPLRGGQIADYDAAKYLFRELFRQVRAKSPASALLKPVFCIHEQERTTEVEEIALIDAGIQIGARRVLLYQDSFSSMLDRARSDPKLRSGYILHIEPQD